MALLLPLTLLACPQNPGGDDEVGDDEAGEGSSEPGPSGPGCEENWKAVDGPALAPAIELPEYLPMAAGASAGTVDFSEAPVIERDVRSEQPREHWLASRLGPPMTWGEFVEAARPRLGGSGWFVEGDMFVTDAQLEAMYQEYLAPWMQGEPPVSLTLNAGLDQVWSPPRALTLTWCVGVVFPQTWSSARDAPEIQAERYDRIVRGIESAAREWERIANVNFVHLREFDTPDSIQSGACQPGQNGIFFRVRMAIGEECKSDCDGYSIATPITELQPEWAGPENPDGWERELVLGVSSASSDITMPITGRHELGHVLGFAHEHERFALEAPEECKKKEIDWRPLTPPDPLSVMGYDDCKGIAPNEPRLSPYDRVAAFYQYNWARRHALMMGGGGSYDDLAYDGSERAGIAWYRPLAHEIELWNSIGDPGQPLEFEVEHRCTSGGPEPCVGDDVSLLRRRPTPLFASGTAGDLDVLLLGPGDNLADEILVNDEGVFQPLALPIDDYVVPIVGSFENQLDDELLLYRPDAAEDTLVVFNNDGSRSVLPVDCPEYAIPLPGRYRGFEHGANDILWYQPDANTIEIWRWNLEGFGFVKFGPASAKDFDLEGIAEYVPIIGDFNGDSSTDLFWYAPGTRTDWLWLSISNPMVIEFERHAHQVTGEYRPFPGDFNGDGIHDILWYSVADELEGGMSIIWYFHEDGGHDVKTYTIHGDYSPIVADLDEDGCSDILWFSPSSKSDSSPIWRCVPGQLDFACDPPVDHPPEGFPIGFGGAY